MLQGGFGPSPHHAHGPKNWVPPSFPLHLGHQGRDRTLSLLRERFWLPGMAQRMMMSICNCPKCQIFKAKPQIPPMEPILCTELLDLIHIDYMSMKSRWS